MIALKHVLVPTDLSETSDAALRYGVAFARAFHATLHLLHVVVPHELEMLLERHRVVQAAFSSDGATDELSLESLLKETEQEILGRLLTDQDHRGITTSYVLRPSSQGGPYADIVRYASERNIDLIVLGTHGRGGVAHMLMGSVAEQVVRKAPCPVLTVHHPEHEFVIPDVVEASGNPDPHS